MQPVIVGNSGAFAEVVRLVDMAAAMDGPVLITGETGTGKNLIAKTIHLQEPARAGGLHQHQLRGPAGKPDRGRALRPRKRGLYRRGRRKKGPLRDRRRRHGLPRRDRRHAAPSPDQAPERARGQDRTPHRQHHGDAGAASGSSPRRTPNWNMPSERPSARTCTTG